MLPPHPVVVLSKNYPSNRIKVFHRQNKNVIRSKKNGDSLTNNILGKLIFGIASIFASSYSFLMKARLKILLLAFIFVGYPGLISQGDPTSSSSSMGAHTSGAPLTGIYLTGEEQVWTDFPKKPALGSEIDQLDLVATLAAQASRTEDQKKEADLDKDYSIKLVTNVIDPDFSTKYPETFKVLGKADHDAYFITSRLKKINNRLRPFAQHPALVTPLFAAKDFSYPSGHSSGAQLQALILGQLFPAEADNLLKRARQIADSRVIAGVHYASDTEAGLNLGDLLFSQLEALPKFKEDLSAAAAKDKIPLK